MKIRALQVTHEFKKQFQRLPRYVRILASEKQKIFQGNPFDVRLATHKLHGGKPEMWAFRINQAYRAKFIFLPDGEVLFLEIGTHGIYR